MKREGVVSSVRINVEHMRDEEDLEFKLVSAKLNQNE